MKYTTIKRKHVQRNKNEIHNNETKTCSAIILRIKMKYTTIKRKHVQLLFYVSRGTRNRPKYLSPMTAAL
jgi:hypothetical protein